MIYEVRFLKILPFTVTSAEDSVLPAVLENLIVYVPLLLTVEEGMDNFADFPSKEYLVSRVSLISVEFLKLFQIIL